MTFWPRLLCAVVCWLLTMLMLFTIAHYYLPPVPINMGLLMELLRVLGMSAAVVILLVGTLAFWLWVWVRDVVQ